MPRPFLSPFGQYGGGAVIAISAVTLFYQLSWVLALLVHAANHFPARLRLGGYFRQLVLTIKKLTALIQTQV